jgi:hypothetical protein
MWLGSGSKEKVRRGRRKGIGSIPSLHDPSGHVTAILALYCKVLGALEGRLEC